MSGLTFDGSNDQAVYPGVDVSTGAFTIVLFAKINGANGTWQGIISGEDSGGTSHWSIERSTGSGTGGAGNPVANSISYQKATAGDAVWTVDLRWTAAKGVCMVFVTKPAAGSSMPNVRLFSLSGTTWTEDADSPENMNFQIGNGTSVGVDGVTVLGNYEGTDDAAMDLYLASTLPPLDDTEIDGVMAAQSTAALLALSPTWLTDADDGLVNDLSGGGRHRSALTGTTGAPELDEGAWTFGLEEEAPAAAKKLAALGVG